ncbi:unnamed protein product [Leptidea sinapis]|uniref:Cysteine-rich DPF motif domain-containing protein n=1 Tax=Leptidea sinapis TaxID=189913 RepID=A0A5E4QB46_9NEOP|nr:unnamed protein product [Leptidea sinapis]
MKMAQKTKEEDLVVYDFICTSCNLTEKAHYKGTNPPFSRNISLKYPSYIMKDPFSPPGKETLHEFSCNNFEFIFSLTDTWGSVLILIAEEFSLAFILFTSSNLKQNQTIKYNKELRKLKDIKGQIEKGFINFKKSPKERITHNFIDTRLELLENQLKNFTAQYETIVGEGEEFFDYFQEDINEKLCEIYLNYKLQNLVKP